MQIKKLSIIITEIAIYMCPNRFSYIYGCLHKMTKKKKKTPLNKTSLSLSRSFGLSTEEEEDDSHTRE